MVQETKHGRDTLWQLHAKEAPEHIKANWPGSAWIVEVHTTTRKGSTTTRSHLFLTSIRTTPEALLRLIRQRWSIENEWHWTPTPSSVWCRSACWRRLIVSWGGRRDHAAGRSGLSLR